MMHPNDFPQMPDTFDRRVRETLETLPEQPRKTRHAPLRRIVSIGLAAALCIGGTAFAASDLPAAIGRTFTLLLHGEDAQLLQDYTVTPAPGTLVDENDHYRLSVDSVLFDESAGAGIISLHLQNKLGDGVMPFETGKPIAEYQTEGVAWGQFAECVPVQEGQYDFQVVYGNIGFCGGRFYLDTARSTENDYYIEGAFIPGIAQDYTGGALRLEAAELGRLSSMPDGLSYRSAPALAVDLPEFEQMPYYQTEDGRITLSQIGLHIVDPEMYSVVDELNTVTLRMQDGSEQVIIDRENGIDQTLYALGDSQGDVGYDTATYVLARSFELTDVQAIVLNGTEYPLSA